MDASKFRRLSTTTALAPWSVFLVSTLSTRLFSYGKHGSFMEENYGKRLTWTPGQSFSSMKKLLICNFPAVPIHSKTAFFF